MNFYDDKKNTDHRNYDAHHQLKQHCAQTVKTRTVCWIDGEEIILWRAEMKGQDFPLRQNSTFTGLNFYL